MNIEKILNFVMTHNTLMIEVLIGVILVLTLLIAIRTFLMVKEEEDHPQSGMNLADLEATLKKLLEKANAVPATGSATAEGASPEVSNLIAEINNLKLELDQKRKEIEDVKASAANIPAGATAAPVASVEISDDERAKLEAKLKELEGKLAEYEIISEDIADLSFYKEQNTKLQKELESLKAGAGATEPAAAPPPPPAPAAAPPPPPEPMNVVDDSLMAEFAAAIESQKLADPAEAESGVNLGALDMDKMVQEASVIPDSQTEVQPKEALSADLDQEKLLKEANALGAVSPEDQKLMGEFENFVKKGES